MKGHLIKFLILLSALFLTGCAANKNKEAITIVGSTALQPLVEKAAVDFQTKHSNAELTVQGGGSGTGLSQVQQGAVDVGNSDVFAENQAGIQADKLVDHRVAVVGITPVVNRDIPVRNLSMRELREIFNGEITNWKKLGGPNQKIVVINRAQGSGIRKTFERVVLKGESKLNTQEQEANGTVQKIVAATPGAISYVSFSYVNQDLKALSVDHVKPTAKNVTTNKWKIWSYEHMYTPKKTKKVTRKFLEYVKSDAVQQHVVPDLGYIPITDMKVELSAKGKVTKSQEVD